MARFIATSGTYFDPLSYEELAKPLDYAQERHDAAAEAYDTLNMETSALEQYIRQDEGDSDARALYDNYMKKLTALQDDLWSNGITGRTKRDLASARSAYSSDILRLQQAILKRQEQSKEYWKTRHDHPDVISGVDPGSLGLNGYLKDDTYGSNWYQYSGNDFATQVGTEAKSIAGEIKRDMLYNGRSIPGYISRLEQDGATSQEVANAYDAVYSYVFSDDVNKTTDTAFSNLTDTEKLLANVLMTNLNSTGALDVKNGVTSEELQRLLPYGKIGLASAVGKPTIKDFEDKIYDHNLRMQEAGAKSSRNPSPAPSPGYDFNSVILSLTNPGYEDFTKTAKSAAKKYASGPVNVITPEGKTVTVEDPWQMSELIYNPPVRKKARAEFGGLDVALPASDFFGTTDSRQHGVVMGVDGNRIDLYTYKISKKDAERLGLPEDAIALYYDTDKIHDAATLRFNKARDEYNKYVESMKTANEAQGLDFEKLAYSPDNEERKFREDNNIPATVDTSDLRSVVTTKNYTGDYVPAVLVGTDSGFDKARSNFGSAIFDVFGQAKAAGKVSKGSRFAFYEIGEGGISAKAKGETDIHKVFGDKLSSGSINSISMFPQDLIHTENGVFRPRFRLTSAATPDKAWSVDAQMLGTQVYNRIFAVSPVTGMNVAQMVDDMMQPITHPETVMSWNEQEANEWGARMYTYLTKTGLPADYIQSVIAPPVKQSYNAQTNQFSASGVTAKDIVRSSSLQNQLYSSIVNYMNAYLQTAENVNTQNGVQYRSDTSTKASPFLN